MQSFKKKLRKGFVISKMLIVLILWILKRVLKISLSKYVSIYSGGDIILLGCTDIRVDYYEKENIDSLEVLKDLILKEVLNE